MMWDVDCGLAGSSDTIMIAVADDGSLFGMLIMSYL